VVCGVSYKGSVAVALSLLRLACTPVPPPSLHRCGLQTLILHGPSTPALLSGLQRVDQDAHAQPIAAVSASEVGIRPCFYWLEAPALSVADRLCAEANARWLKSDCQVGANEACGC
jgi:hypothetical protein